MRDQVILARNALKNDIPLFTLVGKDKFALQTLEYYYSLAKKECSNEFIKDLELLTEDFRKYQEDNQDRKSTRLNSSHKVQSRMPSSA